MTEEQIQMITKEQIQEIMNRISEITDKLEPELGLPHNFFDAIHEGDDWSFIIKLHAVFEAATTYLLVHKIGVPDLEDVFSKIELSNKRTGKISFLKAMQILNTEDRRYISLLSEIRNFIVHDIKNVKFNMESYVSKMDQNQRKNFGKTVGHQPEESAKAESHPSLPPELVLKYPKLMFWIEGLVILNKIYKGKETAVLD